MGLTFHTSCLDCGRIAPEVGDCGYIGYPSASAERGPAHQIPTFGYLYHAFECIKLVTWQFDALRAFLLAHAGHKLHTFCDGDPVFGDGGEQAIDVAGEEEEDGWSEETAVLYPSSRYRLECAECGTSFQSQHSENIKRFDRTVLSATMIGVFQARIGASDPEAFYRAEPLSPGDIDEVRTFLQRHQGHAPVATTVPALQ